MELQRHGIEPLVTIYHNEMPLNLVTSVDGWADRRTVDYYLRFAKVLFERFGSYVKYWIPFNEINCLTIPTGNWNHGGFLHKGTEFFTK